MQRNLAKSLYGRVQMWLLERRRRSYLRLLHGTGIEIGALQRPCHAPHLQVRYVDMLTRREARARFPELDGQSLVETDIVDDAQTLATLGDSTQDFVIASHVIEHLPNPLAALHNWARVLRSGGRVFIAVPDKYRTFDRERAITPLQHVIDDYLDPSPERDYLAFEDFALNVSCRYFKHHPESEFQDVARDLHASAYSIHYHVWDYPSFSELLRHLATEQTGSRLRVIDSMTTVGGEFIFVLGKQ